MRTTLDLDDDLVAALTERHPDLTKTEAIERAIRLYLREAAVEEIRRRAGSFEIEDTSSSRALDRRT